MIEIEDMLFVGNELVEEFLLDGLGTLGAQGRDKGRPETRKGRHRVRQTEGEGETRRHVWVEVRGGLPLAGMGPLGTGCVRHEIIPQ